MHFRYFQLYDDVYSSAVSRHKCIMRYNYSIILLQAYFRQFVKQVSKVSIIHTNMPRMPLIINILVTNQEG
jgi:hypothetical protein